jgi:putative ABC transport system permease protein
VPDHPLPLFGVVSPETAARLGVNATPQRLLVTFSATPTDTETDRLRTALSEYYGPYSYFQPERGNSDDATFWLWIIVGAGALITLSAAGITAGLALVDGRADQATLAAIGAAPRLRKSLAAAQTLTTASLGSLLGTAAGVLPAAVVVSVLRNVPLVIPWLQLAALLVAVPLVGSTAAWLLTRSRQPMARRQPPA